jgi:hypothetical protein
MENLRGDQVKARKGQIDIDQGLSMSKIDSKNVSHYAKIVPSYRWPKKMMEN